MIWRYHKGWFETNLNGICFFQKYIAHISFLKKCGFIKFKTNQPPTTVYSYKEWLDSHKPPKICGSTCINSPSILGIAQWERENGFFRSSSLEWITVHARIARYQLASTALQSSSSRNSNTWVHAKYGGIEIYWTGSQSYTSQVL